MLKVNVATSNTRGFLKNLFDYPHRDVKFIYEDNTLYEIPSKVKTILSEVVTWSIFDYFGIFQRISVRDNQCDVCFSYNRFLKTSKPYYIYLENPSALVNYCWDRPKHFIAKARLKKCFNDRNLKGIICMSKACYSNFDNLYDRPQQLRLLQIYPLIEDDFSYGEEQVHSISTTKIVECLFVAANFELKGGRDILEVFKLIKKNNYHIHLNIITRKATVREADLNTINESDNIEIVDFGLSKDELDEYYKKAAILLNPTRMDSFSLVTLEALKYGCVILATDVYAIKEMDINGFNGFITKSMFNIWNEDGSRDKYELRYPEKTILSGVIDNDLVAWMFEKIELLYNDRNLLEKMCNNSLKLARGDEFSQESIAEKWNKLFIS